MAAGDLLGLVVEGALSTGLTVKLAAPDLVEQLRVGKFVVVEGDEHRYFSLVTDVRLHVTDDAVRAAPPTSTFVRRVLAGTTTYGTIEVMPRLMLARHPAPDDTAGPQPVRTIPGHFVPVKEASDVDFGLVFGSESTEQPNHFAIGQPLDNDIDLALNLAAFVERSNGVFGKSGTGKTFLTRLLLAGIIRKDICSNLVFDMHNEYGWSGTSETGDSKQVQGLQQVFPGKVRLFTLDPESTRARRVRSDYDVTIALDEITIDDVALLSGELNLNPTWPETAHLLERHHDKRWLEALIATESDGLEDLATSIGANVASLSALWRKLHPLKKRSYIKTSKPQQRAAADLTEDSSDDAWELLAGTTAKPATSRTAVQDMLAAFDRHEHVVLEFGRQNDLLSYLLVSNILTRAIRQEFVKRTEEHQATGGAGPKPRPLMITIEEAHKFLDPAVASSTTFGTLAREMRKYNVTLLVVDQRPSAIDDEVMSQLGTRISCLLDDEKDIDAIFSGVSGAAALRTMLATLDSRGQALLLGHALPMPVVIRTRKYDQEFYRQMTGFASELARAANVQDKMSRFGQE